MEVSGRKRETKSQVTDRSGNDNVCQPCWEDGNHLPAHGYCTDCEEYLCEVCFNSHLIPRPLKNHKLLGNLEMPEEVKNINSKDECTEPCKTHNGEIIKYYCEQHDQLGCGPCMVTSHRSCGEAVLYIPHVSMGTADSEQCRKLQKKIESMKAKNQEITEEVKVSSEAIDTASQDAIHAVKGFRKEIRIFFDDLDKKLEEEIHEKQSANKKRMNSISEECSKMSNDLESLTPDIEQNVESKRENQLFVKLKKSEKDILVHGEKLKQAKLDAKFDQFKFIPNEMAVNMMKTLKSLGQIVIQKEHKSQDLETSSEDLQSSQNKTNDKSPGMQNASGMENVRTTLANTQTNITSRQKSTNRKFTHNIADKTSLTAEMANQRKTSIDIQSSKDKKECNITGITVLSDGRLALADSANKSVKILDQYYKIVSYIQLLSRPWCIAEVGRDEIAVTVPDLGNIQFMSVSGCLGRHIKTEGKCYGLVHSQSKLIVIVRRVTFGSKVLLLDMNGMVIKCIKSIYTLGALINHLAISPDHTILYVSGNNTKTVTSLTLQGVVKASYTPRNADLSSSPGLTVDRGGNVYVCGESNIHQLTPDCTKIQVIYQGEVSNLDSISNPVAIAYSEIENELLVVHNNYYGSEIEVFQLQ